MVVRHPDMEQEACHQQHPFWMPSCSAMLWYGTVHSQAVGTSPFQDTIDLEGGKVISWTEEPTGPEHARSEFWNLGYSDAEKSR